MVDILSLAGGFIFGVIVLAIAIEFGFKKSVPKTPKTRKTDKWNFKEFQNPKIMAEYLGDIKLPSNSKVLVNKFKDKELLNGINAKRSKMIKGNYILGEDRALILSGPLKSNEHAFWTVEKEIVNKLHSEFDELWSQAKTVKFDDE